VVAETETLSFALIFVTHQKQSPPNSSILLSVPQVGSGRFYSSASTFLTSVDRYASAWCGTVLPIAPTLHDAAKGPKDLVVWAEGTITYDYSLSIDLQNGQSRKLETDSTYQVALLCSVGLGALTAGQGPTASVANAQVSAQLFLRLVTLGVLEHHPSVTF
jgi:hypothetical protein